MIAVAPFKPSGVRPKSGYYILAFCRILENISTRMSHSKQQRRSAQALFSVHTAVRHRAIANDRVVFDGRRPEGDRPVWAVGQGDP
jgi:hypothetical protein